MAGSAYSLRLPQRPGLLWRLVVLGLTAGALTANAWAWSQGEAFRMVPTAVIGAVAVPTVLLVYLGFPARAGADGLLVFDAWGLRRPVAWGEIEAASLSRWPYLLFAPSVKLVLRDGRVRWLPRETKNLGELHALVLRQGGADHPLVQALETPLHRL